MLSPNNLRENQRTAVFHQLYNPQSMLWLECGFGKTPVTLTTIEHRMRAQQVRKTLVFGPVRVIHAVWEREALKWEHTRHLTFSIIGWPNEKKRIAGLAAEADIYLCNYENMGWLSCYLMKNYIEKGLPLPFDKVVYDEISKLKKASSQRMSGGKRIIKRLFVRRPTDPSEQDLKDQGFKNSDLRNEMLKITERNASLYNKMMKELHRKHNKLDKIHATGQLIVEPEIVKNIIGWRPLIPHIKYATGLTGSPASNGYLDLHGQYLALDNGVRLSPAYSTYRDSYFKQGYDGYSYDITDVGKAWIDHNISDITLYIPGDHTKRPFSTDIMVDLPPKAMAHYKQIEKDMFTRLDDGSEIELFNRASVSNKCLQFANGAAYINPGEPEWSPVHDAKLEALDSIIEEAQGKTILLGYTFKFDAERIMKRYKDLNPINLTATQPEDLIDILALGNKGKVKLMIGHPKSLGHGVDGLHDFCFHIVWFGLPWSLEDYEQLIGRIASGERYTRPVTMNRILARDTLDIATSDSLLRKDVTQVGLKTSIQRYRDGLLSPDGLPCFL